MITPWIDKFLALGIAVIPIERRGKRPAFEFLPTDADNSPTWEPFKTRLPTKPELQAWTHQNINYGVVAGWQGLVILDFDEPEEYTRWLLWARQSGYWANLAANQALQVRSSRGVHVYLRLPHPVRNRKAGKVDIKGDGYVLGPGSIHPSRAVYTPITEKWSIPLVDALSDVLPATLLVDNTTAVKAAMPLHQAADPWAIVSRPPQIPGSLVAGVRKKFRLEDLLPDPLHPTSAGGRWQMTCCPLHDDKHPSMWVDTERQICGCFSGCTSKPLDVINLFARMHGLSNNEALFWLAGEPA